MFSSTPRPHFTPRKRTGTHFTGGWVGQSGRVENLVPIGIRSQTIQPVVAIPTELPGPHTLGTNSYFSCPLYHLCVTIYCSKFFPPPVCLHFNSVSHFLPLYVGTPSFFCSLSETSQLPNSQSRPQYSISFVLP